MSSITAKSDLLKAPLVRWMVGVLVFIGLWALFPPFHLVRLDEEGKRPVAAGAAEAFDPVSFVDTFWNETLPSRRAEATPLAALLAALSEDASAARDEFGTSGGAYYFVRGEGVVSEIQGRRAVVSVGDHRVKLLIAPPVFGNTVRDGTGLLNVNDFSGLDDYNAISTVLNETVEKELMPSLAEMVTVGTKIAFVASSKAPESFGDGTTLDLVPLQVEVAQ